jgi:hypothetical protein
VKGTADVTDLTVSADLRALLKAGSFEDLLSKLDEPNVTKEPRTTIAERKAELEKALDELDDDQLIQLQEILTDYVDALSKDIVPFNAPGDSLTPQQLTYLMHRHVDTKKIKELIEVVEGGLKRIIFEAITAKVAREHPEEPFPEYVSDSIDVPELGKRFCKEGAGRKTPIIDLEKLRAELGEEVWAEVTEEEYIPARTERRLSDFKLMAKATLDPAVLAKIEACLVPTGWKAGSYTVRPIKKKK